MAKEDTIDRASDDHHKLFQDLVEISQDLIFQCDSKGRYTYPNPAWETTFGYTTTLIIKGKLWTN